MANPKGNRATLQPAKKGEPSRNPSGRPKDPIPNALKQLTKEELKDMANLIVKGNIEKIYSISKSKTESVLKVWLASICVTAIDKGDIDSLDKLLNRLIGKVQDEIHHSGDIVSFSVKDINEQLARIRSGDGIQEEPLDLPSIEDTKSERETDTVEQAPLDTDDTK